MCGCNCSFIIEKGLFVDWMTATRMANKLNIFENRDDCKCFFQRNTVPLIILDHCKWHSEIMTVPLKYMAASASLKLQYSLNRNTCQVHCIYTIHGCKCSSKINTVFIKEWMAATTFVKIRNTVLLKKLFPAILFTMNRCLLGSSFSCKYYYPKYKDEQMLYLTSFKTTADFFNN